MPARVVVVTLPVRVKVRVMPRIIKRSVSQGPMAEP